ncbi:MAG: hypothetical protein KKA42_03905 [candidate division Zixibacteria bacterium]|nr:hypothetical protein [candidate division Zixibacteria bacterium]
MKSLVRLSLLVVLVSIAAATIHAQDTPRPDQTDRIRLAEAFTIAGELGDSLWPGWSEAPFAVLLVTDDYEFLMKHPEPTEDFTPAYHDNLLGSDIFYRKRVFDPSFLAAFPAVNGFPTIVVGQAEKTFASTSSEWVLTILHEHFHQKQMADSGYYEDALALDLHDGDQTGMWMLNYAFPYDSTAVAKAFADMSSALYDAVEAIGRKDFPVKLREYYTRRQAFTGMLAAPDARYFNFQVYLEGIARYTEYEMGKRAGWNHSPLPAYAALDDYVKFDQIADMIYISAMSQLKMGDLSRAQRTAFYAIGWGEGLLLDAIKPNWRSEYVHERFDLTPILMPKK